jgi:hypothetical protein
MLTRILNLIGAVKRAGGNPLNVILGLAHLALEPEVAAAVKDFLANTTADLNAVVSAAEAEYGIVPPSAVPASPPS